ncbi:hypothetical protein D3C72_1717020 [compost metagenome]
MAPIRQFFPMRAPFRITAPMPTRLLSPMVQPCSMALCPTVTPVPIARGEPTSVCRMLPS